MKNQILVIHGGDTFETYEAYLNFLHNYEIDIARYKNSTDDWKKSLATKLGADYEVILPVMPNKTNARFEEWELWMNKLTPFLKGGVILIGHSLGGSFLTKYLSKNTFAKKIKAVFLVAAVFDRDSDGYSLASFSLPEKLDLQTENIYLYHSKDDPVVPFTSLNKFETAFPQAHPRILENRAHINQENFPELIKDILTLD